MGAGRSVHDRRKGWLMLAVAMACCAVPAAHAITGNHSVPSTASLNGQIPIQNLTQTTSALEIICEHRYSLCAFGGECFDTFLLPFPGFGSVVNIPAPSNPGVYILSIHVR